MMADIEIINVLLTRLPDRQTVLMSAFALNYNLCMDFTPVIGVRKDKQVIPNCVTLG